MATEDKKLPRPLYAAAAVGDLAYQRLRRLPATVNELRDRMAGREFDVDRLRGAADRVDRLRDAAQRNATALVTGAHAAQERAAAIYTDLVARGEQVVRDRHVVHATVGVTPGPATRPEAPAAEAEPTGTAEAAATVEQATAEAPGGPGAAEKAEPAADAGRTAAVPEAPADPETAGGGGGAGRPAAE